MQYKSFRMAYHENNDGLKIVIPNNVNFPGLIAHIERRDLRTFVLHESPRADRVTEAFQLTKDYAGRQILMPAIKDIGPHFRVMEILHRVEDGALIVEVPDEDKRMRPRARKTKATGKIGPTATVLIDAHGEDFEFEIPFAEIMKCVMEWSRKGY